MVPNSDLVSYDAVVKMLDGGPGLWLADRDAPAECPEGVGAVVATSGSTSHPRSVVLSRDALHAAGVASRRWAGQDFTWHLALSPRYVAGLMVLVRSAVVGRTAFNAEPDLSALNPTGDGDAISLVPTQLHRALADRRLRERLSRMDLVLVGGAALSRELRARAGDAGVRVVETYGMSETCGGVVLDGEPLPGTEVRVDAEQRIWLRGPTLFDGYWQDADATAAAMHDGWLRTSDRGRIEHSRLMVLSRLDDIVISGGINVDLEEVRGAVLRHDADAAVLAVPDPEWGARVVVFSAGGTLDQWREVLARDLPRTWLPRQHVRLERMPRTPGGKPDRARLEALAVGDMT